MHLEAGGDLICLVAPELGDGPLNAIVDAAAHWPPVGATVRFTGLSPPSPSMAARAWVDCAAARAWRAPRPDRTAPPHERRDALARVRTLAQSLAPEDGLARLALGEPPSGTPLARVADPHIRRLQHWLSVPASTPPTGLVGLGPGLTPSGDDLLCGVLIALHALEHTLARNALASAVLAVAPRLTSPLSCAFLRAAAEGEGAENLHRLINAIIEGCNGDLAGIVSAVGRLGHTSGWDALSGVVLAMAAVSSFATAGTSIGMSPATS